MKRVLAVVGLLAVVFLAAVGWGLWTMRAAAQDLQVARQQLEHARSALTAQDLEAAAGALQEASARTSDAAGRARSPIWSLTSAVPKLGDTPQAAQKLALAADAAVSGLAPLAVAAAQVDMSTLFADGRVDLDALTELTATAGKARAPLEEARSLLAEAPSASSGGWVVAQVETAHAELAEQIAALEPVVAGAARVGPLLPPLMGADGPKRYFVGVQAPNETRGTGGLVGTWAVIEARDGRISVAEVGSNGELPDLAKVPAALGREYRERYGDAATLFVNMNISADFPAAAQLWLASWKERTGEELDGALGIDVTAIGELLTTTGATLTTPDGATLTGAQFADYALSGIYEKYPTEGDSQARKAEQEALAAQALAAVLDRSDPVALGSALADQARQRRVAMWARDGEVQAQLAGTTLGHTLGDAPAHSVEPVLINVGWSKLDTYIDRGFRYEVGSCPDESGRVVSRLRMSLLSDLPRDTTLPEYVSGGVAASPDGPVNKVILQAYLPAGAEILEVEVDGVGSQYWSFTEAGRPVLGQVLDLPPRATREVTVEFTEAADPSAGSVLVQPMARSASVSVEQSGC